MTRRRLLIIVLACAGRAALGSAACSCDTCDTSIASQRHSSTKCGTYYWMQHTVPTSETNAAEAAGHTHMRLHWINNGDKTGRIFGHTMTSHDYTMYLTTCDEIWKNRRLPDYDQIKNLTASYADCFEGASEVNLKAGIVIEWNSLSPMLVSYSYEFYNPTTGSGAAAHFAGMLVALVVLLATAF